MSQLAEKFSPRPTPLEPLSGVSAAGRPRGPQWLRSLTTANVLGAAMLVAYAWLFVGSIARFWFHPDWTTDDALQQAYPFHEVKHPGLFAGDIVTDVMKGYLAPLHYWLSYGVTMLTGSPIMTCHWVMLIQVLLTAGFLFMGLRSAAGVPAAMVGVAWLLHDRNLMQRLTGGLVRGWAAVVVTSFLCFVLRGNHRAVLATILAGCLLNPPATLVVAFSYGMLLVWRSVTGAPEARREWRKRLFALFCVSPLFAAVTLMVVHRPPQIGQMVSFEQASQMPEFSRPRGRFPFVPLNPAGEEIRVVGLEAFVNRFYSPPRPVKALMPYIVLGSLALLALVGALRRRVAVPAEVVTFGAGALVVYFLSRLLAFRLYVPNRHLQIPVAIFFICAFTIGAWRAFHRGAARGGSAAELSDSRLSRSWGSVVALAAVVGLVCLGSGLGLRGTANFNYSAHKKGLVFHWLRDNTPLGAVVAGHPTHIDGVFLFAERRGFITTETGHPFYVRYNEEVQRRNQISLRAHYARSLEDLVSLLEPEGVTHFVFRREDFSPAVLPTLSFFPPLDQLARELVSRPPGQYAYAQLPTSLDPRFPFVTFIDAQSTVVDVKALKAYLQSKGWTPPQAQGVRALRQLERSPELVQAAAVASGSAAPERSNGKVAG